VSIITNIGSLDILNIGGEYVSVFLIIIFSISLLVSDTVYWNEHISNALKICSNPLLIIFITIVIFKIILVI